MSQYRIVTDGVTFGVEERFFGLWLRPGTFYGINYGTWPTREAAEAALRDYIAQAQHRRSWRVVQG